MKGLKGYSAVLLKNIAVLLLVIIIFASCKKDNEVKSNVISIEGKWTGNKGFDNEVPTNDLLITIKNGGVIEETNSAGAVKGSGSWTLNGIVFTAHYQFKAPLNTVYTFKGNFNKATGKIEGTWGFDSDDSVGKFYLNKL